MFVLEFIYLSISYQKSLLSNYYFFIFPENSLARARVVR
jgi:hypothetical protein